MWVDEQQQRSGELRSNDPSTFSYGHQLTTKWDILGLTLRNSAELGVLADDLIARHWA